MERSIVDLGNLAGLAYSNGEVVGAGFRVPTGFTLVASNTNVLTGFNGAAFYNSTSNTLVVAIAGTNPINPVDHAQNIQIMLGGVPPQVGDAFRLTEEALSSLKASGISPKIAFTGHSLGGYVSQIAVGGYPGAHAVVFNSPGLGGLSAEVFPTLGGYSPQVTYVYSSDWGAATAVHSIGMPVNGRVVIVPNTFGHSLANLLGLSPVEANSGGVPTLTDLQVRAANRVRGAEAAVRPDIPRSPELVQAIEQAKTHANSMKPSYRVCCISAASRASGVGETGWRVV